jgi:methylase of polypeptide subunit release factors
MPRPSRDTRTRLLDPPVGGLLRESFEALGLSPESVTERLGLRPAEPWKLRRESLPTLSTKDPADSLIQLLVVGEEVDERRIRAAVSSDELRSLGRGGVLTIVAGKVRPLIRVTPFEGLFVASDLAASSADHVPGIYPAAVTLAHLTVRRPIETALDLGTGSGLQALLAGGHARDVLGTDINPRAIAFAELNARLNGVATATFQRGSWFDPAAGRTFDLIVCNPPLVISPDLRLMYRDSGLPADTASRALVAEIPAYLSDGGFATVVCDWAHQADGSWSEPLERWVEGSGCDALLIRYASVSPMAYAVRYNEDARASRGGGLAKAVERWVQYYEEQKIEAIASGVIVLRRRDANRYWTRAIDARERPAGSGSDQLVQIFGNEDYLAANARPKLLQAVFQPIGDHWVDQRLRYADGAYSANPATVRFPEGAGLAAQVDARAVNLLFAMDGQRTLGQAAEDLAAITELEEDAARELALGTAEELLRRGFIRISSA